jgi:hypothetical protein
MQPCCADCHRVAALAFTTDAAARADPACIAGDAGSTHGGNELGRRWRSSSSPRAFAVNVTDPPAVSPPLEPMPATAARRRVTLAALLGLAAVGGPVRAQMGPGGGGGGHGMRGEASDGPRPDKDTHSPDAPPRDLVAAFARRVREGVPELALAANQREPWRDFVASLDEVGRHNERRLQRILFRSASVVSAVDPLKTYIAAEVDEGEGRQEALAELKVNHDKLDGLLDERQRGVLTRLFVATRSELQAGSRSAG